MSPFSFLPAAKISSLLLLTGNVALRSRGLFKRHFLVFVQPEKKGKSKIALRYFFILVRSLKKLHREEFIALQTFVMFFLLLFSYFFAKMPNWNSPSKDQKKNMFINFFSEVKSKKKQTPISMLFLP